MRSPLAVLPLLLSLACAAAPATVQSPWRLELVTSGRLSGRGVGNVTLTSEGSLEVVTVTRKTCAYRATSAEVERVSALLADSHPEKWGSYVPEDHCCDRVEYRLVYGSHAAKWIDEPLPMPEDVAKLSQALTALRTKYSAECMKP